VAERAWRKKAGIELGFRDRRRLRRELRSRRTIPAPWPVISAELGDALDVQTRWAQLSRGNLPRLAKGTSDTVLHYKNLRSHLAAIGAITVMPGLVERDEADMDKLLHALKNDEAMLMRLPMLNKSRSTFDQVGLTKLIDRIAERGLSAIEASQALMFSWLSSWLQSMQYELAEYGSFSSTTQNRILDEFRDADIKHIALAAARVRRAVAQRQVQARDQWPEQRQIVRDQVSRKSRHKPIRQLVEEAPDLLLATKPCWAMSPLVVSQVLPSQQLFNIVVFDEASQIEPADAIPSIMRARQVVVAGDNKQLPPTNFFSTAVNVDEGEDVDGALDDFESILDRLQPFIPSRTLTWHYRSRDERLIAFSNKEIYNRTLVTFPSTYTTSALRHIVVRSDTPPGGSFMVAESERIVDLILTHAVERPEESLGVITLGLRGAETIHTRLRTALTARPELANFFDEDREIGQRFFVKNIENVQGDERDAIILSVGGSRAATGGVNHNFGPINQKGGERRLNVAITRARKSLVVVSSFEYHELREDNMTSRGLQFLRDFLRFADQKDDAENTTADVDDLSPIESDIVNRLRAAGMNVRPRYGSADSRIGIAAGAATSREQLLLAIEIDGAAYHNSGVRERDRLRPAQLQRMGWRYERIWGTEWLRDSNSQIAKLSESLRLASEADPPNQPGSEADELRPQRIPVADSVPARRLPRPRVAQGLPISQHTHQALVAMARWLDSDGLLRDEDEMIDLMMVELGYRRRGSKIVEGLRAAVRTARMRGSR
jgi:hypothetical protein